jgi:hypothetical protein
MSTLTVAEPSAGREAESSGTQPGPERPATSFLDVLRRRPGWPLVLLFVGYPLWWVLGLADTVTFLATGVMAFELLRVPKLRVPPGFGVWLLFLVWVLLGAALVQVAAPGAVNESHGTRYLTWAWRLMWYLKATVVLLYIGNMRSRLSLTWICRVFSWMFIYIVAGGLLGVVAPGFQMQSLAELILPHSLTSYSFVYTKVHLVASEGHTILGATGGRTSAPFAFSNVWGLNFACFLPFFILGWLGPNAGWRRVAAPTILLLGLIPVVFSLNRGLWTALVGAILFVLIRSALAGNAKRLATVLIGLAALVAAVTFSPLGTTIDSRLNTSTSGSTGPSSATSRTNLGSLGLTGMASTSPVAGFGTTRNVQGNFNSIAGGSTTFCPRCAPPALGTQGHFFLVTFTQGIIGALLYFAFLILQLLRYIRMRTGFAMATCAIILMHFITSAVYSADNLAIVAIIGSLGLAWRSQLEDRLADQPGVHYAPDEPIIHDYVALVREHRLSLVALALAGAVGGGALAYHHVGHQHLAVATVYVPPGPQYNAARQADSTLDTIAQFASSGSSLDAIHKALGKGIPVHPSRLIVTATPNTRILHISYVDRSAKTANTVVTTAAKGLIAVRKADLAHHRHQVITQLDGVGAALKKAIRTADTAADVINADRSSRPLTYELLAQADHVNRELAEATELPLDAGNITGPVVDRVNWDGWSVDITSGLGLGFLVWVAFALLLRSASPRIRHAPWVVESRGLRILAAGPAHSIDVAGIVLLESPTACVGVGTRRQALVVASRMDALVDDAARRRPTGRVVLVTGRGERVRKLVRERRMLERAGGSIAGVVIVDRSPVTEQRDMTSMLFNSDIRSQTRGSRGQSATR